MERTQDLIFYLHLLNDQKRIGDIPIFVDSPMAVNATSIFRVHPECYDRETREAFIRHHRNPFGFNSLRYIDSVAESKELNDLKGPAIIVHGEPEPQEHFKNYLLELGVADVEIVQYSKEYELS